MAEVNERESVDEVIRETRRIKAALAEALDFDVDRILDDARRRQQNSDRTVLSPPAPQKS